MGVLLKYIDLFLTDDYYSQALYFSPLWYK